MVGTRTTYIYERAICRTCKKKNRRKDIFKHGNNDNSTSTRNKITDRLSFTQATLPNWRQEGILQARIQGRWNGWIFTPPPPPLFFLSPLLSFFSYPSNIEIIFDFSDIITKIHPPFQNPGSALVLLNLTKSNSDEKHNFKRVIFSSFFDIKQLFIQMVGYEMIIASKQQWNNCFNEEAPKI